VHSFAQYLATVVGYLNRTLGVRFSLAPFDEPWRAGGPSARGATHRTEGCSYSPDRRRPRCCPPCAAPWASCPSRAWTAGCAPPRLHWWAVQPLNPFRGPCASPGRPPGPSAWCPGPLSVVPRAPQRGAPGPSAWCPRAPQRGAPGPLSVVPPGPSAWCPRAPQRGAPGPSAWCPRAPQRGAPGPLSAVPPGPLSVVYLRQAVLRHSTLLALPSRPGPRS